MTTFTATREILDRLNDWEERHQADPESVLDIWQEVILQLDDYDDEATAASPYANNNAGFITVDGREFLVEDQLIYSYERLVAKMRWYCIEPREGE